MKNLPIFIALSLLALGCIETEYIEVEKLVRDTVKVKEFTDRYFSTTDTVEIPVVVEVPTPTRSQSDTVYTVVYDTVWMHRIDTVWITTTTTKYDTIMVREKTYGDTLIQYLWPRGAFGFPMELEPQYVGFFEEVDRRGITYQGSGSAFLIQFKKMDSNLQAYSFDYGGQIVIAISDKLTIDQCYVVLWRELSRVFLKKEYSADPDSPMNPFWPGVQDVRWSNRLQFPEVANEIFN